MMSSRWSLAAAFVLAAAGPAAAQQPARPQAQSRPQQQPTIQQQFDAASTALTEERWQEALRLFEELEARLVRSSPRNLAIVRVRKASALLELGRGDEAAEALRLGIPALPATDRSLDEDRFTGHLTLGRIAERRFEYPAATAHYRTALAIAVPSAFKVAAFRGLIQTRMFFDAPAALRDVDEALTALAAAVPADRQLEGQYRILRGRVLLNMGRFVEARQELERATRLLGGATTTRVDIRDLVARSDLAIAAHLGGDEEAARRYLAYTGAGRMPRAFIPIQRGGAVPRCGNGIEPNDVSVVELSIRDTGTVGHASPVYSSKRGEAALHFARAVSRWRWDPDDIEDIEPLFRAAVRVEVRCTHRSLQPGDMPPHDIAEIERWAAARGIPLEADPARGRTAAGLRADLAALEARHGPSAPQLLVPLMRLGVTRELRDRDRIPFLERALAIAAAASVPDPYLSYVAFRLHYARRAAADRDSDDRPNHAAILSEPALRGNPYVAAVAHIGEAAWFAERGRWQPAVQELARVRALDLPADHMLMADVQEVAAVIETGLGNHQAAQAAWRAIPADRRWCLFTPRRKAAYAGESDFPARAQAWGFEGWTVVESLVGRAGAVSQRTIAAYPPFVFDEGSLDIARRLRFETTFEPESGPCAVHRQSFRFMLPR
jgi:tetratricopeptide (TPR) repeat protein